MPVSKLRPFPALWLLLCLLALPAAAGEILKVEVGHQLLHHEGRAVSRVTVGHSGIADVVSDSKLLASMLAKGEILLTGKRVGSTNLTVWRKGESRPRSYQLLVVAAPGLADAGVREHRPGLHAAEGGALLELKGSGDSLVRHAEAAHKVRAVQAERKVQEQTESLREVAGAGGNVSLSLSPGKGGKNAIADSSRLDFDTTVQADIRIVEVSRTTLQELGFNFMKNTRNTTVAVSPPGLLSGITSDTGSNGIGGGFTLLSQSGFLPVSGAFNLLWGSAIDGLIANLSVLESNGLAYTLAEPSLVAMSGQTATFLAGGEFPIPVIQGGTGGSQATITIVYKEFGVRLALTPTVLSADRMALKVAPEVSELDFNTAVQSATVSVPGLKVRRADTTVELGDGESFVISGLVSRNMKDNVDKVPGLGDLPVLGAFFRNTRMEREDKELIMIVTPHLVRPLAKGTKLPKMPGERYEHYHPGAFRALLLESGSHEGEIKVGFED